MVDGVDVRRYQQKALHEKIAMAMQKSELFHQTILENISWGNHEELLNSCKAYRDIYDSQMGKED